MNSLIKTGILFGCFVITGGSLSYLMYKEGYYKGRIDAFDEATKELKRIDDELRKEHPNVFKDKDEVA